MTNGGDMTDSQRIDALEVEVAQIKKFLSDNVTGNWTTAPRLIMSWPVGDIMRRTLAPWYDATGYNVLYINGTAYHTGNDLNLAAYGDSGQPVYACADGILRFSGIVPGWQQSVVVLEHTLEDGRLIYSRYAHVTPLPALVIGSRILRCTQIANIADYAPKGPQGDHLHFDLAWKDLGKSPGDWPGMDRQRVITDYADGCKFIAGRVLDYD